MLDALKRNEYERKVSARKLFNASWTDQAADLRLEKNKVDVWLISLAQPEHQYQALSKLLSSCEHERAQKFKSDKHRRRFVVAHGAMRSILAEYLKTSPRNLEFINGANGKPKLAGAPAEQVIGFNLSHSYETALLAVVRGREIGVDIEYVKEAFSFDEVVARFFTGREIVALHALPAHLQRQAFFKCWTSKEAFLKAKGTGLSTKLDEVQIMLAGDYGVSIAANVPGWMLSELTPVIGYEAALVIEGDLLPMNYYLWH